MTSINDDSGVGGLKNADGRNTHPTCLRQWPKPENAPQLPDDDMHGVSAGFSECERPQAANIPVNMKISKSKQNKEKCTHPLKEHASTPGLHAEDIADSTPSMSPPPLLPRISTDVSELIQSAQLSMDVNVVVIAVAGVECPSKMCFTWVLLHYLEYRSICRNEGKLQTGDEFQTFLEQSDTASIQNFQHRANHAGLHVWPHHFQLADDVVVMLMYGVQSDIGTMASSMLFSSVQFLYLGPSSATSTETVDIHDWLQKIMTGTDFLLYSSSSGATQFYPVLCSISEEGEIAVKIASSEHCADSNGMSRMSMMHRASDAIHRTQVDLFMSQAFPADRHVHMSVPSVTDVVAKQTADGMQFKPLPQSYVSKMFDLCENVIGRTDKTPPVKIGFNGQALKLGDFQRFIDHVESGSVEMIPKWKERALKEYVSTLCKKHIFSERYFYNRVKKARVCAFKEPEALKEMLGFNGAHPKEWNGLCKKWDQLEKLWNTFDSSVMSGNSEKRAGLIEDMDKILATMRLDSNIPSENIRCQWKHRDHLIRGEYVTSVCKSVDEVMKKIASGDITSTQEYITTRNSVLDVAKLLEKSLRCSLLSPSMLPQYRLLNFGSVDVILCHGINQTDAAWSAHNKSTFSSILNYRRKAMKRFTTRLTSLMSSMVTRNRNSSELEQKLHGLRKDVMCRFDERTKATEGSQLDERECIVSDQKWVLLDNIEWWLCWCNEFIHKGFTNITSNVFHSNYKRLQLSTIDKAVVFYLLVDDSLAFCLRSLPLNAGLNCSRV